MADAGDAPVAARSVDIENDAAVCVTGTFAVGCKTVEPRAAGSDAVATADIGSAARIADCADASVEGARASVAGAIGDANARAAEAAVSLVVAVAGGVVDTVDAVLGVWLPGSYGLPGMLTRAGDAANGIGDAGVANDAGRLGATGASEDTADAGDADAAIAAADSSDADGLGAMGACDDAAAAGDADAAGAAGVANDAGRLGATGACDDAAAAGDADASAVGEAGIDAFSAPCAICFAGSGVPAIPSFASTNRAISALTAGCARAPSLLPAPARSTSRPDAFADGVPAIEPAPSTSRVAIPSCTWRAEIGCDCDVSNAELGVSTTSSQGATSIGAWDSGAAAPLTACSRSLPGRSACACVSTPGAFGASCAG
ncbi:TPA: hypothetical protein QDA71_006243 [Burkholderia vietnamiensis]|uniref:hypothetical protein n=1 Tax=Burkholderia vietnamiensis TaxID=60552 RepID=UPI001ABB1E93|nr:hypothetical protein [Burkholderia vietnamiensis]HDR8949155.1 hypothetical protein [Burkholderia vietnamiensis]HDR9211021.1 hypothetical protein [Burkholderia vietnamiensis]